MKVIITKNHKEMSQEAAKIISNQIIKDKESILGLATGGTPEDTYKMLIDKQLDWSNIVTFNLDEYSKIPETHEMSYRYYMNNKLFKYINIDMKNTHVPSGMVSSEVEGPRYDKAIKEAGGIDLQLLGLGMNAHIGFNEPGSPKDGGTAVVLLTQSTIEANSRYFKSIEEVPTTAISMGIGTILKARKIVLVASGESKAEAVMNMIEGPVTEAVPASFLQTHDNAIVIIDEAAASMLKKANK